MDFYLSKLMIVIIIIGLFIVINISTQRVNSNNNENKHLKSVNKLNNFKSYITNELFRFKSASFDDIISNELIVLNETQKIDNILNHSNNESKLDLSFYPNVKINKINLNDLLEITCYANSSFKNISLMIFKDQMLLNKSNSNQVSIKIEKVTKSDAGEYVCYGFPDKMSKYSVKISIEVLVEENVSFNHKIVKRNVYEREYDENSGEVFVDFDEKKQFEDDCNLSKEGKFKCEKNSKKNPNFLLKSSRVEDEAKCYGSNKEPNDLEITFFTNIQDIMVEENGLLEITCKVRGPFKNLKALFYKNNKIIKQSDNDQVSIKIEKVTTSDAGEYVCYGFANDKSSYMAKKLNVVVSVKGKQTTNYDKMTNYDKIDYEIENESSGDVNYANNNQERFLKYQDENSGEISININN